MWAEVQEDGVRTGSGLGAGEAPGGNQLEELQIHSKCSFSLPILVQQPQQFRLDQNQRGASHPCPQLGVLKVGRALAGMAPSWGVVGPVAPAAWAPTDVPSPERLLLSCSVIWRDRCPGRLSTGRGEWKPSLSCWTRVILISPL